VGYAIQKWWRQNNFTKDSFTAAVVMDWHFVAAKMLFDQMGVDLPFLTYVNATIVDSQPNLDLTNSVVKRLEKEMLQRSKKVICISSYNQKILRDHYEVSDKKVVVVNNDIDFEPEILRYRELEHNGKNVLFIGRIAPQKGLMFLLDTAKRVVDMDAQVKFIVCGDGEMLPQIMETVAEKHLERNILFTGWLQKEDKKQLYRTADMFVMPSPREPFGLTALEAIRSGVPVIASETSGFLDVVPSTPTFPYYNTDKFGQLLLYYLHNVGETSSLLKTQQDELGNHNWGKEVKKIADLLGKMQK
jgi:glycosyltransferase involved in cell wall biosynthesis